MTLDYKSRVSWRLCVSLRSGHSQRDQYCRELMMIIINCGSNWLLRRERADCEGAANSWFSFNFKKNWTYAKMVEVAVQMQMFVEIGLNHPDDSWQSRKEHWGSSLELGRQFNVVGTVLFQGGWKMCTEIADRLGTLQWDFSNVAKGHHCSKRQVEISFWCTKYILFCHTFKRLMRLHFFLFQSPSLKYCGMCLSASPVSFWDV